MILFLGLVRIASEGGLMRVVVRVLRPILRRGFPQVPENHPAMHAMIMNLAANVLGLGNAATPFGLKAMVELDRLNPHRGVATDAMALFLAINATSVTLFPPTGTVVLRAATGSAAPFAIWVPTLIATVCSTAAAVAVCLALARLRRYRARPLADPPPADPAIDEASLPEARLPGVDEPRAPLAPWQWAVLLGFGAALVIALGLELAAEAPETGVWPFLRDEFVRYWLLPLLIAALVLVGVAGRVRVYDALIEGGKEGLQVAVRIAPYLVAILVAIGMFRASGALEMLVGALDPLTSRLGVPAEALPMALMRPLSGSGAFAVLAETLETHGPDSFVGNLASTLMGSTETTFYVMAVYLGAVRVRESRHILPACLIGDLAGFAAAVAACHLFFG
jgi:spore maturation protein SpmB